MRTKSTNVNEEELWKKVADYRKKFSRKTCMAPAEDCDGRVIKAHTIQRKGGLSLIAENGEVYRIEINIGDPQGPFAVKKAGVKEATTFFGFCSKHDREIFAPIETAPFISSQEQNFLFAYRGVAKEAYAKTSHLQSMTTPEEMATIRPDWNKDHYEDFYFCHMIGAMGGAWDLFDLKERLDSIYCRRDFGRLRHLLMKFKKHPSIVCTSVCSPDYDFDGRKLQDFGDFSKHLNSIMVTVTPIEDGGLAIFSYLDDCFQGPRDICESLKSFQGEQLTEAIIKYIFSSFDNTAWNIFWWDSLSAKTKESLIGRLEYGANPTLELNSKWFQGEEEFLGDWEIEHIWEQ